MSWILDPSGKSVANRAQKVVSDMHLQLERQNRHIQDLEHIVATLQEMCTDPIESEIRRLEQRRTDLQNELNHTDELLIQYKKVALESKLRVAKVLNRDKQFSYNVTSSHYADTAGDRTSMDDSVRSNASDSTRGRGRSDSIEPHLDSRVHHKLGHYHQPNNSVSSEDEHFEEEFELLADVKRIEPRLLFLIHRNNSEDIIVYVPPQVDSENSMVSVYRLRDHSDRNSVEELTYFEKMMAYGPKIIPNHDRDDPDIREMVYSCALATPPSIATNPMESYRPQSLDHMGDLVLAMELPAVPEVRVDLWKASNGDRYWATTTIQGVKFAVLERIYVMSEVRWGFQTVVGIELAGRHPISGKIVTEMVNEAV